MFSLAMSEIWRAHRFHNGAWPSRSYLLKSLHNFPREWVCLSPYWTASFQVGHTAFGLHQRFGNTDRLPLETVPTLVIAPAGWEIGEKISQISLVKWQKLTEPRNILYYWVATSREFVPWPMYKQVLPYQNSGQRGLEEQFYNLQVGNNGMSYPVEFSPVTHWGCPCTLIFPMAAEIKYPWRSRSAVLLWSSTDVNCGQSQLDSCADKPKKDAFCTRQMSKCWKFSSEQQKSFILPVFLCHMKYGLNERSVFWWGMLW